MKLKRTIGLDLSLTSTGIAWPDGAGTLKPKGLRGMRRLAWIRDNVGGIVFEELPPGVVMIEGYSYGSGYGREKMGEVGGVVRLHLYEGGADYIDVAPSTLKIFATGKGNSKKDAVLAEAIRRLGYEGSSHDVADALWLRELGNHLYDQPTVELPKTHTRALDKFDREELP